MEASTKKRRLRSYYVLNPVKFLKIPQLLLTKELALGTRLGPCSSNPVTVNPKNW